MKPIEVEIGNGFITVDYEEWKPETYKGVVFYLRVNGKLEELVRCNKHNDPNKDMEEGFKTIKEKFSNITRYSEWVCSSSFDNYYSDLYSKEEN